jgi:hypothetical protein
MSQTGYLVLRDQEGHRQYLWVNDVPTIVVDPASVVGVDLANGREFSWLLWAASSGALWYLYPAPFGGLFFSQARPGGSGTDTRFGPWVTPGNAVYQLTLTDVPSLTFAPATVSTYFDTSGLLRCRTCDWVGHLDRSNVVRRRDGTPDFTRCPADGSPLHRVEAT